MALTIMAKRLMTQQFWHGSRDRQETPEADRLFSGKFFRDSFQKCHSRLV
jgi:hypothetical protein